MMFGLVTASCQKWPPVLPSIRLPERKNPQRSQGFARGSHDIRAPVQPDFMGGNKIRSALHGYKGVSRKFTDGASSVNSEIGHLRLLHIGSDSLDRVEFGCIGRTTRHGEMAVLFFKPRLDQTRAMSGNTILNDQQPLDLAGLHKDTIPPIS